MDNKKDELQEELLEQQLEEGEIEVLDAPNQDQKYKEMEDRYQRSLAEFDNYRKRTMKEMSARYNDGISYACEKLIPMVDNFERALNACEDRENSFYQGVAMIARQFEGILGDLGVEEIQLKPGDKFDPNFHNAVAHVEDENFGQSEVADILQKGYIHKDKVLRHSVVKVAN